MDAKTYRIFISYKRANKDKVFRLKNQIEAATDEKCWIDLDGIESDAQFARVIAKAIESCEIVLFMHSSEHLKITESNFDEDWTIKELNFARKHKKRIVIVKLDETELEGVLYLQYGLKQYVNANNPNDLKKLYEDIKQWIHPDSNKSKDFIECENKALCGDVNAMFHLASRYEKGLGTPRDDKKAVEWYRKAAEQDPDMVINLLTYLANKGDVSAQNNLGIHYYNGQGVLQDYSKAVEWYRKAAEQGDASAQTNLGICYEWGQGVAQDYDKAVEWFNKSAEQGNASAQYSLGVCYYLGQGVAQDYPKAVEWFNKSAEQGDASAQYNLGVCYYLGQGVPQDYDKAVEWYRKAAEQDHPKAQYYLGNCYQYGEGVQQSIEKAAEWYRKAAEHGE